MSMNELGVIVLTIVLSMMALIGILGVTSELLVGMDRSIHSSLETEK